jgi:hypothetical protein
MIVRARSRPASDGGGAETATDRSIDRHLVV